MWLTHISDDACNNCTYHGIMRGNETIGRDVRKDTVRIIGDISVGGYMKN